jgi:osmotically inducible protein OsmC
MALSLILEEAKLKADQMNTTAVVTLEQVDGGWSITSSRLTLKAKIPGADSDMFQNLAGVAKSNCPVSKLLKADVSLDAELVT